MGSVGTTAFECGGCDALRGKGSGVLPAFGSNTDLQSALQKYRNLSKNMATRAARSGSTARPHRAQGTKP
jgi:hypothetical protein